MRNSRPVRCLDSPTGLRVYVLAFERHGYARVENARTGRTFETPADRLHKPD